MGKYFKDSSVRISKIKSIDIDNLVYSNIRTAAFKPPWELIKKVMDTYDMPMRKALEWISKRWNYIRGYEEHNRGIRDPSAPPSVPVFGETNIDELSVNVRKLDDVLTHLNPEGSSETFSIADFLKLSSMDAKYLNMLPENYRNILRREVLGLIKKDGNLSPRYSMTYLQLLQSNGQLPQNVRWANSEAETNAIRTINVFKSRLEKHLAERTMQQKIYKEATKDKTGLESKISDAKEESKNPSRQQYELDKKITPARLKYGGASIKYLPWVIIDLIQRIPRAGGISRVLSVLQNVTTLEKFFSPELKTLLNSNVKYLVSKDNKTPVSITTIELMKQYRSNRKLPDNYQWIDEGEKIFTQNVENIDRISIAWAARTINALATTGLVIGGSIYFDETFGPAKKAREETEKFMKNVPTAPPPIVNFE